MDEVFRALADPSRRELLDRLNDHNGQNLRELSAGLGMTRQSVSKHLSQLEAAGLVTTSRQGREKIHHLNAAPINAIADRWIRRYDRQHARALADLTTALERTTVSQQTAPTDRPTKTRFTYTTYITTTPEQLWQALTDPAFTQRYWGATLTSDWEVGSTMTWEYAGVVVADPAQVVLEADPPRRLAYTWQSITPEFAALVGFSDDFREQVAAEPRSKVSFDIEPTGRGQVRLSVVHDGFEPGSEMLNSVSGGWPMVLSSLKTLLETGEAAPAFGPASDQGSDRGADQVDTRASAGVAAR